MGFILSSEQIGTLTVFNFLRGCSKHLFSSVSYPTDKGLVDLVKTFDPSIKASRSVFSNLKQRPAVFRYLPISRTSLDFISFVKKTFPDFNGDELYALSGTFVSYKKILLVRPAR